MTKNQSNTVKRRIMTIQAYRAIVAEALGEKVAARMQPEQRIDRWFEMTLPDGTVCEGRSPRACWLLAARACTAKETT